MNRKNLVALGTLLFFCGLSSACSQSKQVDLSANNATESATSKKDIKSKNKNNSQENTNVVTTGPVRFRGLKPEVWEMSSPKYISPKSYQTNDKELAEVIKQGMAPLDSSPKVKWNVSVLDLNNPKFSANVTNWEFKNDPNNHRQFSASTIKLFILLKFEQLVYQKNINPDKEMYHLKKSDIVAGSGYIYNHQDEKDYSYAQLRDLMMINSDNIATNVLIDYVGGPPEVNKLITEILGPNHESVLERKMMDNWKTKTYHRANRISSLEVVKTLSKLYNNELNFITPTTKSHIFELMSQTKNRTKLPAQITSFDVFNKTGESAYRGIENDLGIIKSKNSKQAFAICVLTEVEGENVLNMTEAKPEVTKLEVETIGNVSRVVANWMRQKGRIN